MSRIFGPVRQNGYVVGDLHTAVRRWTSVLGVGPFFVFDSVKIEDFRYHGAPSRPDMSIALACSGGLQIQLIQQHNDAPSLARDFRAAHGEGLQHLTAWTLDFEADLARLTDLGYGVIQQGRLGVTASSISTPPGKTAPGPWSSTTSATA